MVQEKYIQAIKKIFKHHCARPAKLFIFGSSLEATTFHDIDLGVLDCRLEPMTQVELREAFDQSTIPYHVDIIDFSRVEAAFKQQVLEGKVLWIT